MNTQEAATLSFLRMKHSYSFAALAQAARAIWGRDWVSDESKQEGCDDKQGLGLVRAMELTMGLEQGESNIMSLRQCHCEDCKRTDYYITPPTDTAKECGWCGSKSTFLI